MTRLVLGSASPGRLRVLRQAGVDPLVVVSGVDEDAVVAGLARDVPPQDVVGALATAKAEQVAGTLSGEVAADCVVIGCDSMLYLDGRLCGKPRSVDEARLLWQSMARRTGHLLSGHCLIRMRDSAVTHMQSQTSTATVRFGAPSQSDLQAYLASGEPLQVAGGFTLDGLGGWFVDGVDGDPSTVIGLSLPLLRTMLARCDVSVAALWAANVGPSA